MKINTRVRLLVGAAGLCLIAACGPGGGVYVGVAVPGPYGGPYPYPGFVGPPPVVYGGGYYEALNDAGPAEPVVRIVTGSAAGGPSTGVGSGSPAQGEASGDRESGASRGSH